MGEDDDGVLEKSEGTKIMWSSGGCALGFQDPGLKQIIDGLATCVIQMSSCGFLGSNLGPTLVGTRSTPKETIFKSTMQPFHSLLQLVGFVQGPPLWLLSFFSA